MAKSAATGHQLTLLLELQEKELTDEMERQQPENFDMYDFQGFDPRRLRMEYNNKNMSASETVTLIVCALRRGTKIPKGLSEKSRETLLKLWEKCGMVESGKKLENNTLTPSRLIAIFPFNAALALAKGLAKPKVTTQYFPVFYSFQNAPSIIPREMTDLYNKWESWALSFDYLINPNSKSTTDERKRKVRSYGQSMFQSTLIPNDTRVEYFAKLLHATEKAHTNDTYTMLFNSGRPIPVAYDIAQHDGFEQNVTYQETNVRSSLFHTPNDINTRILESLAKIRQTEVNKNQGVIIHGDANIGLPGSIPSGSNGSSSNGSSGSKTPVKSGIAVTTPTNKSR